MGRRDAVSDVALSLVFVGLIYVVAYIVLSILELVYPAVKLGNYVYAFFMSLMVGISVMLMLYDKFWRLTRNDYLFIGADNILLFTGIMACAIRGWHTSALYGISLFLSGVLLLFLTGVIRVSPRVSSEELSVVKKEREER